MAATQNPIYLHFIGRLTLTRPETNKAAPSRPLFASEDVASQF